MFGRRVLLVAVMLAATACERRSAAPTAPTSGGSNFISIALTGAVRECHEPGLPGIAGASVTVTSGSQSGRTALTDRSGRYTFEGLRAETVRLLVNADGFQEATLEAVPGRSVDDILLEPQTATIEWDSRKEPALQEFSIPFRVTRRGPATLSIFSSVYECGTVETFFAYVRRDLDRKVVLNAVICSPAGGTTRVTELLSAGGYHLHIYRLHPADGRTRTATVTHPR